MARLLWQQRQDIGPPNRIGASMVYMASRGRTLFWGGYGLGYQGDTWEWDGEGWAQLADTGPAPTEFVGLAFDSNRDVVVLFTRNANYTAGDTWEWDGEAWTQIDDAGPGVPNGVVGMVYDSARKRTVLEGGSLSVGGSPTHPPIGTWVWDGAAWTQVADVGPPQVAYYPLAYDSSRERVIHFGGLTTPGFVVLSGDTWEWDGTLWEQVADIGPNPRYGHAMAGNLLFGGYAEGKFFRDTWSWDGKHWRERQDIGPSPRGFSGMAWDSSRNRAVLFGGEFQSPVTPVQYYGDTWESIEIEQ
jgi:hypothetical protein